jgi:hypothetical protein
MRLRLHPLFDGDAGGNSGGSGATPPPATPPAADPLAAFNNLLGRSSDAAALARQLFDENYQYRRKIETLQSQVPGQGAAVLTPEQAAAWQAYQQLGAPDQVQTTLQQAQTLKRDLELRSVSDTAKVSFDVLKTLAGNLAFEVRDEQVNGAEAKVVYVKDADGKDVPLDTYATQKWAAFLPALRPGAAAAAASAPSTGASNPPAQRGTPPPAQFDPKNPPRLSSIDWKK